MTDIYNSLFVLGEGKGWKTFCRKMEGVNGSEEESVLLAILPLARYDDFDLAESTWGVYRRDRFAQVSVENDSVNAQFETLYAPALGLPREIAKALPDWHVELFWYDGDDTKRGLWRWQDGVLTEWREEIPEEDFDLMEEAQERGLFHFMDEETRWSEFKRTPEYKNLIAELTTV